MAHGVATSVAVIVVSYLVGCVSTAYYIVRWKTGQDIRDLGSGNAGAQNAGLVLGRPWFFLTLFADGLKGVVAVLLCRWLGLGDVVSTLAIVAVVSGHCWPVQMQFRGGMGIATSLGALLTFNVWVLAAIVGVFFFTYWLQSFWPHLTRAKRAARSAVAAINFVALGLVLLKQPLMHWLSLIILGGVHYAGYRHRVAHGWPRPPARRDEAAGGSPPRTPGDARRAVQGEAPDAV